MRTARPRSLRQQGPDSHATPRIISAHTYTPEKCPVPSWEEVDRLGAGCDDRHERSRRWRQLERGVRRGGSCRASCGVNADGAHLEAVGGAFLPLCSAFSDGKGGE